jgi:hypothetical protein
MAGFYGAGTFLVMLLAVLIPCVAILPYGHAYQTPGDFTESEYAFIAATFPIFTVEKRHASGVYGNPSAPAGSPRRTNSIAASVGTARKIKALNPAARVLLYWNSVLSYNMYECEEEVQPSWLMRRGAQPQPVYNYSVAALRAWWVSCVVGALHNSSGALDGVFIDAAPKLARLQSNAAEAYALFGEMLDEVRRQCPGAFVVFNGNFIEPGGGVLANATELLPHADAVYVESMATLDSPTFAANPARSIAFLHFVAASASAAVPAGKQFFAHGLLDPADAERSFGFGLALFLLVAPDPSSGWFLANDGYSVREGLLAPHPAYELAYGAPRGPFSVNGTVLSRTFANATVAVDLKARIATIVMGSPDPPLSPTPSVTASPSPSVTASPSPSIATSLPTPPASGTQTANATAAGGYRTTAVSPELTDGARAGIALGLPIALGVFFAAGMGTASCLHRHARWTQGKPLAVSASKRGIHTVHAHSAVISTNPFAAVRAASAARAELSPPTHLA